MQQIQLIQLSEWTLQQASFTPVIQTCHSRRNTCGINDGPLPLSVPGSHDSEPAWNTLIINTAVFFQLWPVKMSALKKRPILCDFMLKLIWNKCKHEWQRRAKRDAFLKALTGDKRTTDFSPLNMSLRL